MNGSNFTTTGTGPTGVQSAQDRHYSAPRNAPAQAGGAVPAVVSVGYSPNVPTPGGAVNGQSKGQ